MSKKNKIVLFGFTIVMYMVLNIYSGVSKIRQSFQMIEEWDMEAKISNQSYILREAASKPRVLEEECVIRPKCYELGELDYETLLKIVEAEAGGEGLKGKILVANVVMNRVKSAKFPNNVKAVVYQQDDNAVQFSPVADGRINRVQISEETRSAVESVIYGEDYSEGALYFVSAAYADKSRYDWFAEDLDFLFSYKGHEFYK